MITLAITTYKRPELTYQSFKKVLKDKRISEILIIDDCSPMTDYILLQEMCQDEKVVIFRNEKNIGCYHNKRKAIDRSENEWVIILDSDNVIDSSYLDSVAHFELQPDTIYAPEFARPHFDYRGFSDKTISKSNVSGMVDQPRFDCLINTCNYLVNRDEYLRVWKDHPEPWTADTLFMNYNWLESGNRIHVVEGMQYDHLVHGGSHYQEHVSKTGNLANELMNKLKKI